MLVVSVPMSILAERMGQSTQSTNMTSANALVGIVQVHRPDVKLFKDEDQLVVADLEERSLNVPLCHSSRRRWWSRTFSIEFFVAGGRDADGLAGTAWEVR